MHFSVRREKHLKDTHILEFLIKIVLLRPCLHVSGYFESETFSFRIQKFPRPHIAYSNRIRPSTRIRCFRIHSSTQGSSALSSEDAPYSEIVAGNLLCSPSTLCRHIGLLFGERLDTLFTSSDSKISGFTRPHVIGCVADIFFSTLGSGFIFFSDSLSNSQDTCGR